MTSQLMHSKEPSVLLCKFQVSVHMTHIQLVPSDLLIQKLALRNINMYCQATGFKTNVAGNKSPGQITILLMVTLAANYFVATQ